MKITIFHGTMGNPDINWFPWLRQKLEANGHQVYIPHLPTPTDHSYTSWKETFIKSVPHVQSLDILIGHSCGASFIPHLIADHIVQPKTAILVAPFTGALGLPDYDQLNQSFWLDQETLACAKNEHVQWHIFCGDNDPYVPLSQPKNIAQALDIHLTIIPGGGHLNAENGYTTFPEILNVL